MSSSEPDPISAAHQHNRNAWDARALRKQTFTRPAADDDLHDPINVIDGCGWLEGNLKGQRVLCLASGGGRQSALYAAAGGQVTVVDISPEMLAIDREVAAERGLNIQVVEASMDDLSALAPESFEVVIQPVSTCYVPDVVRVFREIARVIVPGGIYISQHKQPGSLQADTKPSATGYELIEPYYRTGPLPPVVGSRHREEGTLEYLHRLEELIGGMCRSGFVIEDLIEPVHASGDAPVGSFKHRGRFVAPYLRIKARRSGAASEDKRPSSLWTP